MDRVITIRRAYRLLRILLNEASVPAAYVSGTEPFEWLKERGLIQVDTEAIRISEQGRKALLGSKKR